MCGVPAACDHPATACERCGALVAVLVRDASVLPVFLGLSATPCTAHSSSGVMTSPRRRKEAWSERPCSGARQPCGCCFFLASRTHRLANFKPCAAARELATSYFSWIYTRRENLQSKREIHETGLRLLLFKS